MTSETILTFTLVVASIVGVLNYLQNRGKTRVDVVATQNATIGSMSARLDTQGVRLDLQADKIDSLTAQLKTSNETGASWQRLAEDRLVKLDGMPVEIDQLKAEIQRLHNAAGIVADTNLASAHAREINASNATAAVEAAHAGRTALPIKADTTPAGSVAVIIPADTALKTVDDTAAVVSESSPPPGQPGSD